MEFSKKQVAFKAIYSKDFREKTWVESIISKWNAGETEFALTTSGSTGLPKSIKIRKEILVWSANATKQSLMLDTEVTFCCLPTQKTGGFMQIIRALHFGWKIYFDNPTANPFSNFTNKECSFTSLTPFQLESILNENGDALLGFKNVLVGGAPISKILLKTLLEWNSLNTQTVFWETYGMTETASHIALKNLSANNVIFKPQSGVEIGEIEGKLLVRIKECNLFELTNDLVAISAAGFEILGRADNVINTGGVKVHPEILEPKIMEVLHSMGIKRSLYITAKQDEKLGQKVVLVMQGAAIKDEVFVLEMLKRDLPNYMSPKEIVYTPNIAFTDTGKIVRKPV